MEPDTKDPQPKKQPEDGTNEDLNLTNRDATIVNNERNRQPDAPVMTDTAGTEAVNDNLTQSVLNGSEPNPEFGDAADPTFETL